LYSRSYTLQLMNNLDLERLRNQAIDEALNGNYEKAISLNKQVLAENESDIDSLMQLAHAYWQTGETALAKKYYRQVLSIEPNNGLAKKRLALINVLNNKKNSDNTAGRRKPIKIVAISDLIEEPGKTKIVKLSNIGKPQHLSLLKIGEEVFLKMRKRRLEIRDIDNNFIGCLPDDISKRLIGFIQEKGIYETYIFSIDRNEVKVFIKEIFKSAKFHHISSFINEDSYLSLEEEKEEESLLPPIEETDLDLDSEKILLSPEEILAEQRKSEEEEEDEDEEDKETYREYEE